MAKEIENLVIRNGGRMTITWTRTIAITIVTIVTIIAARIITFTLTIFLTRHGIWILIGWLDFRDRADALDAVQ